MLRFFFVALLVSHALVSLPSKIMFPPGEQLQRRILANEENIIPPGRSIISGIGFPPKIDEHGLLWIRTVTSRLQNRALTHDAFVNELGKIYEDVYQGLIKQTGQEIAFLVNGAAILWTRCFYRMMVAEEYWNHDLDFLRFVESQLADELEI